MVELYYRAIDVQYAGGVDEFGDPIPGDVGPLSVRIVEYEVVKRTQYGVVIADPHQDRGRRFIHEGKIKRFAHQTREAAIEALAARRERQATIYEARARHARNVAAAARAMRVRGLFEFYGGEYAQLLLRREAADAVAQA